MTTDEDLMLAVKTGDRDAFASLFDRYRDPVWRFFRRRLADRSVAEELTQETFLAVLQGAARYEPRAALRSYMFGIAFNLLAAARRKAAVAGPEIDWSAPGIQHAAPSTADPVLVLWVRQALAGLDQDDREILMLREYEALSYDEIATLVGVPVGTVRSRLFRARLALKDKLEAQPETKEAAR